MSLTHKQNLPTNFFQLHVTFAEANAYDTCHPEINPLLFQAWVGQKVPGDQWHPISHTGSKKLQT